MVLVQGYPQWIYIYTMLVSGFLSNKRGNGWTDQSKIVCETLHDPREGLRMVRIFFLIHEKKTINSQNLFNCLNLVYIFTRRLVQFELLLKIQKLLLFTGFWPILLKHYFTKIGIWVSLRSPWNIFIKNNISENKYLNYNNCLGSE